MSLKRTIGTVFSERGRSVLAKQELVVALSLDRDWFDPETATAVIDRAIEEELVTETATGLALSFDFDDVTIPEGFVPDPLLADSKPPFEAILDELTAAGIEKRTAVKEINRLQSQCGLGIAAAGALYARQRGVNVTAARRRALAELREESADC